MSYWKKKPVVIEAFRWTGGEDQTEDPDWIVQALKHRVAVIVVSVTTGIEMRINTFEGVVTARPGDWIIKGVNGELYPCKPDIFEKTYEAVDA